MASLKFERLKLIDVWGAVFYRSGGGVGGSQLLVPTSVPHSPQDGVQSQIKVSKYPQK